MSKQLALALRAPADHGEFLHFGKRHGSVIVWKAQCRPQWSKIAPADDLAVAMAGHIGEIDRYFTPNEFRNWRRVDLLSSLRACYIDLDGYTDLGALLDALPALDIPQPSLVVESGRGLHLYWPIEAVPATALPMWQALQDELVRKLANLGADPSARDCTRVLRIVGSVNGKNAAEVRGWQVSPRIWTLHELADDVLGPRKTVASKVVGLEGARVKRAASVHQRTGPYRLWHQRYQDLCLIADHHAFMRSSGVGEGNRDRLLFLLSVALSWFTSAEGLAEHIQRIAKTYTPSLSVREVVTYTKPIIARAMAARRGEKYEWNGRQKDPRYEFRTETLRSWLGNLITPGMESRLIALGTPKSVAERAEIRAEQKAKAEKTRQARSRVQEGRYSQTRTEYMAKAEARAKEANQLREGGLSLRAIAAEMSISKSRAEQYLKLSNVRPVLV